MKESPRMNRIRNGLAHEIAQDLHLHAHTQAGSSIHLAALGILHSELFNSLVSGLELALDDRLESHRLYSIWG